jgi:hypothetical protein
LRKGSLTSEIRVREPREAQVSRFNGGHTSRSLRTRDKADALRRLPDAYIALQAEFDAEATKLATAAERHQSIHYRSQARETLHRTTAHANSVLRSLSEAASNFSNEKATRRQPVFLIFSDIQA